MVREVSTDTTAVVHPDTDTGRSRVRHRQVTSWITTVLVVGLMATVVLDGVDAVPVWGIDEKTTVAVGTDGTGLSVEYPSVVRPALAAPFSITVERPGGFDGDVELAVSVDYLKLWDVNGIFPSPAEERSEGDRVVWSFTAPEGEVLTVVYEARIQPAAQLEFRHGSVALLDPSGDPVLGVRWSTRVLP